MLKYFNLQSERLSSSIVNDFALRSVFRTFRLIGVLLRSLALRQSVVGSAEKNGFGFETRSAPRCSELSSGLGVRVQLAVLSGYGPCPAECRVVAQATCIRNALCTP